MLALNSCEFSKVEPDEDGHAIDVLGESELTGAETKAGHMTPVKVCRSAAYFARAYADAAWRPSRPPRRRSESHSAIAVASSK